MPGIILLLVFLILPKFLVNINKKLSLNKWLSDIVICYALGILLGNTKWLWLYSWGFDSTATIEMDQNLLSFSKELASISVILAIPLLLMINNVKEWLKHAGKNSFYFLIFSLSISTICLTVGYFFMNSIEQPAIAAGMMTGVYVGGTPNMVAISKALNADESMFTLLNATDTFCSALFFLFMLSVAKPLLCRVLPPFKTNVNPLEILEEKTDLEAYPFPPKKLHTNLILPLLKATGLAIVAIALSIVPAILIPDSKGEMNSSILILALTSIGIILSFSEKIRQLPGVYNFAQYLLLVFGLSTGFLADFGQMIAEGGQFLLFNAVIIVAILVLNTLLAIMLRIDTDSFIVCSCANVLGPPFIAQTCAAIKNRELIPVGISLGLLGLALANYLGVLVYTILSNL
jgi:uncharacterized membrane protein